MTAHEHKTKLLGKASGLKTLLVTERGSKQFDETLNENIALLQEAEIIEIQFVSNVDAGGVVWFSALIIYKEEA